MPMPTKRLPAKKMARNRKLRATGKKAAKTRKPKAAGRKASRTAARTVTTKTLRAAAAKAAPASASWGVYIRERNGKFRVEHRYMPEPDVEQPSTFDDEVTKTVGEAETLEEAERIKLEYENKLAIEAEEENDEDDD